MARKRHEESSDEEFQLSDGSQSPALSRLKRPRRNSTRERTSLSPHPSSFQDDKDDVVHIPDSLDNEDESALIPDSAENSLAIGGDVKPDLKLSVALDDDDDADICSPLPNFRRASRQSDENADHSLRDVFDDDSRQAESVVGFAAESVADSLQGTDDEKDLPTSGKNSVSRNSSRRVAKNRTKYVMSESEWDESDEEDDDNDEDDEVYNANLDSPDGRENDADSDFETSSKRVARKKTASPSKNTIRTTSAKKGLSNGAKVKKTAVANRSKNTSSASKSSVATVVKNSTVPLTSGASSSKKRLGARIPIRSIGIGRPSGVSPTSGEAEASTTSRAGSSTTPSPRFRAGLSRKAVVPRLHSYLPRK